MRALAVTLSLLTVLVACDDGVEPLRPPAADAGPIPEGCEDVFPAVQVFATSCAVSGACHVPGGQYPDLSREGVRSLVGAPSRVLDGETLVVANDPDASFLFRKVSGTQGEGGGGLMPIGTDEPIDAVSTLRAWIEAGAPTTCAGEPPVDPIPIDPNTLDPGALFTCSEPAVGSPARLRRVDRTSWTHSTGNSLGSIANDNPLHTPEGDYSTYSAGVTLDAATLDLYLLVVPEASRFWRERDVHPRQYATYSDGELRCMFEDAAPDDACVDHYVEKLLRVGTLFRAPSDGERSRLRAFLLEQLAAEGDPADRATTLQHVASAAWLASGALFRPELGGEDDGARRRLTDDELALALGAVLSTHPPGSTMRQWGDDRPAEPDRSNPELGYLGQIRAAADDGTIQDPEVLGRLLRTYRGGVDLDRLDLGLDHDSRENPSRGEHYLAPRIAGFFREYFDYEEAISVFKDTPSATSPWDGGPSSVDKSYSNLQHGYYGYESNLAQQLDDTIARAVIETEASGGDVFRALLTTRTWRLPSNLATSDGTACASSDDCTASGYTRCQPDVGLCGTSISNNTISAHRVYGLEANVPDTEEGRWVTMAEGARAGVLTHPAWLSAHGGNFEDDGSAIHRGRWIREHLYCETVPGLDLVRVEAQLVPSAPELRARDRIAMSIESNDTCMGCHRMMNSLGMPFEIYNHAGFPRGDDHGMPPSGHSVIDYAPDPSLEGEVADAIELTELLAASPYARRCFIRHVFRYFMGRDETLADACTLAAMEDAFAGGSFFAMLETLVTSDTFLYRTVDGGAP